ncbi:ribonuclease J [Amaricoccus tamworthensis]|uniref:ribonuclease J n=1 Tax=Amaricoccus tamworthensis TaxID=57002 RepID=UPI003C7A75F1
MAKNKNARLIYAPLGGAGEIGMNMYLYGYGPEGKERFILVDVGVTFGNMESSPGVDLIMADISWIQARADRLDAIFITHGHEDHVGALGLLWPRLHVPVYARRFTTALAQGKMERAGLDTTKVIETHPWPKKVKVGPFEVGFVPVSHSIPESSSLVIDTPAGRILHTGDFKVDPTPVVGEPFDPDLFGEIGREGVKVLVCDSTNVFSTHPGRSEATLEKPISELISNASGMVVATTFASNVARLKTLALAGKAAGREIVVLGRAMNHMLSTARATEVLDGFPPTVDATDAQDIPRRNLMLLATGSQGERRAASAQLSEGKYLGFELKKDDTFLFSSKTIPGNEVSVARILNRLSEKGVNIIDDSAEIYHVSGHPNRPDLARMHELINADILIPMHGEHRHLSTHAALGEEKGMKSVIAPNGTVVDLTGDTPEIVDNIETGRLYLDGTELIGAMDGVILERIRIALRGHVSVSVIIDEKGRPLGDAWVELQGLPEMTAMPNGLAGEIEDELGDVMNRADRKVLNDDDALEDLIRRTCTRTCNNAMGKKPICSIMISRLAD